MVPMCPLWHTLTRNVAKIAKIQGKIHFLAEKCSFWLIFVYFCWLSTNKWSEMVKKPTENGSLVSPMTYSYHTCYKKSINFKKNPFLVKKCSFWLIFCTFLTEKWSKMVQIRFLCVSFNISYQKIFQNLEKFKKNPFLA